MRYGIARGLFSNEAGLGSAPLVHATANTDHPVRQGLYGIFEVFVDTLLICTTTGLVILVTGAWDSGETGAALRARRSSSACRRLGHLIVTVGLVLFAFSTIIGWSYYGETGIVYLLGTRAAVPYRIAWLVFIYLGAVGSLHLVWDIADTLNGLMAIPNLVAVLLSIPLIRRLQREFFRGAGAGAGGVDAGGADGRRGRRGRRLHASGLHHPDVALGFLQQHEQPVAAEGPVGPVRRRTGSSNRRTSAGFPPAGQGTAQSRPSPGSRPTKRIFRPSRRTWGT